MQRDVALRAAPVKVTARAYSIPARWLYAAINAGELRQHWIAGTKGALLLFAEVDAWVASKGPPPKCNLNEDASCTSTKSQK